jgi:hypothetical protein
MSGKIQAGWRWKFEDQDDSKWVVQKRFPEKMAKFPDVVVEPLYAENN